MMKSLPLIRGYELEVVGEEDDEDEGEDAAAEDGGGGETLVLD